MKNASGLVEVLIVMAIIGTTLVSSMLLVSRGFIEVKNNQTEDSINGIIVQVLDRIKNSTALEIINSEFNTLTSTGTRNFYLNGQNILTLDNFESPSADITTCTPTSQYNVIAKEIASSSLVNSLCIQIKLRKQTTAVNDRFVGTVVYAYTLNQENIVSKLDFVKYNTFTVTGVPGGATSTGGSATGGSATGGTLTGGSATQGTPITGGTFTGGSTNDNNSSTTGVELF